MRDDRRFLLTCGVATALALLTPNASADDRNASTAATRKPTTPTTTARASSVAAKSAEQQGVAGQKVHVDPVTHKIKDPEPEDIKALSDAAAQTVSPVIPLQIVKLPNGALMVDLQGQVMDATVVSRGADGRLITECVRGLEKASEVVRSGKPKTTNKEQLDEK
jgi:hypothetical protein